MTTKSIKSKIMPIKYDIIVNDEDEVILSDDHGRRFAGTTMAEAFDAAEVAQNPPLDPANITGSSNSIKQHRWDNDLPRAIADVLLGHEEPEMLHAAAWLAEHENDRHVWDMIEDLLDGIISAAQDDSTQYTEI